MRKVKFLVVGHGKSDAFTDILKEADIEFARVSLDKFSRIKLDKFHAILFMPGYFEWDKDLSGKEIILKKIKNFVDRGGRLYTEYVQCDDYILYHSVFKLKQNHPPRHVALERAVVRGEHYITKDFSKQTILPVRNCTFLPSHTRIQGMKELLSFAVVRGTHHVMYGMPPKRDIWPALLTDDKGGVSAAFELSQYKKKNFPLQKCWEKILKRVILYLLSENHRKRCEKRLFPIEIELDRRTWSIPQEKITVRTNSKAIVTVNCRQKSIKANAGKGKNVWYFTPPSKGKYQIAARDKTGTICREKVDICHREKKYRQVLDKLIKWYFESGVMPKKDGTAGVYEGFRSTDHKLIPIIRSDCNIQTAEALFLYGRLQRNKRYQKIAGNIFEFLFKEGYQDLNPRHATHGFWKFYNDYEEYPHQVFCNDNSWAGMALFTMYKWTNNKKYLEHVLLTSRKAHKIRLEKLFALYGERLNKIGIMRFLKETDFAQWSNPFVPSMYIYAYQFTGDKKYLKTAERIANNYKNHPTSVQTNIFPIFMFSVLYQVTGNEKYRREIDKRIKYIKEFQVPCGAVRNFLPNVKNTKDFYGLTEVDVTHKATDTVVDQLYINAPLAFCLYTAYKATGEKMYKDFFHQVMDFLVRIQIQSKDKRLNGAWMRAFDYKNWDYYGSNGDIDWGPYCIESGWSNTWIAKTLALYLMDEMVI